MTPFTEEDNIVTLYPTIECVKYTVFKDVFPLKDKFSAVEYEKTVEKLNVEPLDLSVSLPEYEPLYNCNFTSIDRIFELQM